MPKTSPNPDLEFTFEKFQVSQTDINQAITSILYVIWLALIVTAPAAVIFAWKAAL
ncbi:hypothetical protein Back2_17590 [Nocardioides baekrokdamisoli]|uniref:Uncharacterized protein n=1 Tax=Nocardioides baekrokdamisoli TaxID=1804624 RepID=A0A3G9IH06_9ACTN|nr:hypothetical protein [Nocardioides baekrokdamisoli]BBH17472.1 hypothetical protein Back2_17590 [Nocardioides baekrokdamisoli]